MRWVYSTEELSRLIAQDRVRLGERATRAAVCLVDRCSKRLYPQDGTAYGRAVLVRTVGSRRYAPRWHDAGVVCRTCAVEIRVRMIPGALLADATHPELPRSQKRAAAFTPKRRS